MGLARRAESGLDRAFQGLFGRKSHIHVRPIELAWKLVKEMEGNRAKMGSRIYVPHRYGVYLCPEDVEHFAGQQDVLVDQLRSHLLNQAHEEGYSLTAPPEITLHVDRDLKMGQFGIATEKLDLEAYAELKRAAPPSPGRGRTGLPPTGEARGAAGAAAAAAATRTSSPAPPREHRAVPRPVVQALVLRVNGRATKFEQVKIVVGRDKDADLRLTDPNVSREHAVIFWDGGRLYVKDLGSTNGTLLNGRPVDHSMLRNGDVVTAGESRIAVETG